MTEAILEHPELSSRPNSIGCNEVMGMIKLTEEKAHKLRPIIERILSRKYGKEVKFVELTIGDINVDCKNVS
jgi:hypothetical protein